MTEKTVIHKQKKHTHNLSQNIWIALCLCWMKEQCITFQFSTGFTSHYELVVNILRNISAHIAGKSYIKHNSDVTNDYRYCWCIDVV